jgi:hypothetical protein
VHSQKVESERRRFFFVSFYCTHTILMELSGGIVSEYDRNEGRRKKECKSSFNFFLLTRHPSAMKDWMHTLTHIEIIIMFQHHESVNSRWGSRGMRNDTFFLSLARLPVIIDYKSFNFASFAFHVAVSCPDGNVCACIAFKTLENRLPAYTIKTHERTRIINKKV